MSARVDLISPQFNVNIVAIIRRTTKVSLKLFSSGSRFLDSKRNVLLKNKYIYLCSV